MGKMDKSLGSTHRHRRIASMNMDDTRVIVPHQPGSDRADADFSPSKIRLEGAPRPSETSAATLPSRDRRVVGPLPRMLQVDEMRAPFLAGNDPAIASFAREIGQQPHRGRRQRNRPAACLCVRKFKSPEAKSTYDQTNVKISESRQPVRLPTVQRIVQR